MKALQETFDEYRLFKKELWIRGVSQKNNIQKGLKVNWKKWE